MDLGKSFTRQEISDEAKSKMEFLNSRAKELAHDIDHFTVDSREKSLAITKLEEAIFWANAAIARN